SQSPSRCRLRKRSSARCSSSESGSGKVLIAACLLMIALIFGTALQQRWDVLTQQMIYLWIEAALLATRPWDRWSIDAPLKGAVPRPAGKSASLGRWIREGDPPRRRRLGENHHVT